MSSLNMSLRMDVWLDLSRPNPQGPPAPLAPSPTHCRLCYSPPPPYLKSSRIQPPPRLPRFRRR
uniref:Uncharacterized protein n=1 Tax=Arundo donax TaxID=35708 RepID=A0A0A9FAJ9_ARUDO